MFGKVGYCQYPGTVKLASNQSIQPTGRNADSANLWPAPDFKRYVLNREEIS